MNSCIYRSPNCCT